MNEIKGLVHKDWRLMGRQLKLMLVYVVLFIGIFSFTLNESGFMSSFFSVVMFLLAINCFAYDEQVNFEKLIASSPISRSKVVVSRYIAALSVGFGGGIITTLVNYSILAIRKSPEASLSYSLITMAAGLGVAILLVCILFPILYKFGVNKSRIIMLFICGVPSAGVVLLTTVLPKSSLKMIRIPPSFIQALPYIAPIALLALLVFSITLSTRILRNKEY